MSADPNHDEIRTFLDFLITAEKLKRELRHSWLADGRRESVAEHCWMMSLLAILFAKRLDKPINQERVLKMIAVHDLVETVCGDIPSFEDSERKRNKRQNEQDAIQLIREALPPDIGCEVAGLWEEYESRKTLEAYFVYALDRLEVQIQHNLAPFDTWMPVEYDLVYTKVLQPCAGDAFLSELAQAVFDDAENKMEKGGVDVTSLRQKHGFQ